MIFVTLGSQKFQFDRLLRKIDELIESGVIREQVFAQTGYSTYTPKHYKYRDFLDRNEFEKMTQSCTLFLTHGGTGAIMGAVKKGKKVIAVPRLSEYGEHVDDHQLQLLKQFDDTGIIAACYDMDKLGEVYEKINGAEFSPYVSNTQKYITDISEFIEKKKRLKVCLVASSGGHLEELSFVDCMDMDLDCFLITEKIADIKDKKKHVYYVDQINRTERFAFLKIIKLFLRGNKILKKEKPDCFISTGALISIPILILGKLRRKKIIFIETFARVESGSVSGRIAYHLADLFVVYWKNLLKIYPKAVYIDPFEEKKNDSGYSRNSEISV